MVRLRYLLFAAALSWPAAAFASEPAASSPRSTATDWSTSIGDWTTRAGRGDPAAPRQLCGLYFDGRGGEFDAVATLDWCRRAAELGDAGAIERMGFLSLAGIGTRKDLVAAARQCSDARSRDPAVSTGFCLAAAVEEQRRGGGSPGAAVSSAPVSDGTPAATIDGWRDLAERGDRAAEARLCGFYFGARGGAFEAARAADWCRRAARYGDAAAMRRLGLMRLWGVGVEQSVAQAETLCLEAQARDPAVSASYCLAAVRQERTATAAAPPPSHFAYTPGSASATDALAHDRALGSVHATTTGLQFSCRDILRWPRYEMLGGLGVLTPDSRAFGRPILEYRDEDYAALDRAAAECAEAVARYDRDGSERRYLAEFREMLPLIKARQPELDRERQVGQADVRRCVEALRRARAASQKLSPAVGTADPSWADPYSCAWSGRSELGGGDASPPRAAAQRPAAGGR